MMNIPLAVKGVGWLGGRLQNGSLQRYLALSVVLAFMIYAMVGIYVGITLFRTSVKIADTRKYLLFIVCVIVGLSASLLRPNSNFLVHFWSLIFGFISSLPIE